MAHDDHHHGSELDEMQLRVRALETILAEKGYVEPAALDKIVEAFETRIGPHIVARAWNDPEFKQRLLADATAAINADGHHSPVGSHLIAIENAPSVHHMVVCTLCSCYTWEVLGLPPAWYKSAPYRSRAEFARPAPAPPRFAAGERVRARNLNPTTHTRLPRYARGKVGAVEAIRGCHVYPDSVAFGAGENPQWLFHLARVGGNARREIARAQAEGDPDTGETYYRHWQSALRTSPKRRPLSTVQVSASK